VINNVETLMNIPWIMANGADRFCEMGTPHSKGTKVFSISGDVERPGTYELEMGSSLNELVHELALAGDVKMVRSVVLGRIVPADRIEVPLSYETLLERACHCL